jgi:hypothetical protein
MLSEGNAFLSPEEIARAAQMEHRPWYTCFVAEPVTLSLFVTIAKLWLPPQDIGGEDNVEKMDASSMKPWRVTEEHRPPDNIQRSRKEVSRQSSILTPPVELAEKYTFPRIKW